MRKTSGKKKGKKKAPAGRKAPTRSKRSTSSTSSRPRTSRQQTSSRAGNHPLCILVTGAAGYIGSLFVERLRQKASNIRIMGVDVRPPRHIPSGAQFRICDVSSPDLADVFREVRPDVVVHLASIVSPPKNSDPGVEYKVDVLGTKNVLECAVESKVKKIVLTSSGAAYGYHADNPEWLKETDALRGNDSFPYSKHKRLVEEMLAAYRQSHPGLAQLIFRPGTVLGTATHNQITNLFEKRFVPGIAGSDSPFVFIWDEDVVECLVLGASTSRSGIYNLAGDGKLTLQEIAALLGKPFVSFPPGLIGSAFAVLKPFGLSRYGPEQVDFLRYRPVLANDALKNKFGFTPRKTTREVFQYYIQNSPYINRRS